MFEWDDNKNIINTKKHGVSFELAVEVFGDKNGYEVNRVVNKELRTKFVGAVDDVILSVVYAVRKNKYRLISARCASKIERRIYYDNKRT
jgi:uncharacterized DUF497 family protein